MPKDSINITPEMIKNLSNMLKNSDSNYSHNSSTKNINSNYSTNENGKTINSNYSANNNNDEGNQTNKDVNIDFETILKMKTIVERFNKKDDPRTNLLYSLKPYLNKSRQQKLDKYANILKISDVATFFKDQKKGDEN